MPEELELVVSSDGERTVFALEGELDALNSPRLRAALMEHAEEGGDAVIDLARLKFIDSSGIGVLVGALKRYEAAGHKLTLRAPSVSLRRVLEMTGLSEAFVIEG